MAVSSRIPRKRYTEDQVNQQSTLENNEQMQDQEKKMESQQQKLIDLEKKIKDLEEAREPKQVHCITFNTILLLGFIACLTALAVYKYQELQQQYQELQQQYQELQKQYQELQQQYQELQQQYQELRHQYQELQQQYQELQQQYQELQQQYQELHQQYQDLHQQHMEDIKSIARQQKETEKKYIAQHEAVERLSVLFHSYTRWKFEMKDFSVVVKSKDKIWISPAMYTHVNGYKVIIQIHTISSVVSVLISGVPGEFDSLLDWPAKAKFTLQLVSHNNSDITVSPPMAKWMKTDSSIYITYFFLVDHCKLYNFLYNDTLKFIVDVLLP